MEAVAGSGVGGKRRKEKRNIPIFFMENLRMHFLSGIEILLIFRG